MSAQFHVDLGPFSLDVQLDDHAIRMQRGPLTQTIAWDRITGATLVRESHHDASEAQQGELRAAQFLGPDAAQKIHDLRDKVG